MSNIVVNHVFSGFDVRLNSDTKMLSANDLMEAGNRMRLESGMCAKLLSNYFASDSYKEFESALLWEFAPEEIKATSRGKDGGTWVHPFVFVDIAMWLSPELKVSALKWLLKGGKLAPSLEDSRGEQFKTLETLRRYYPKSLQVAMDYKEITFRVAKACGMNRDDEWHMATEEQLKLRDRIYRNIAFLAGERRTLQECVTSAIRKTEAISQQKD